VRVDITPLDITIGSGFQVGAVDGEGVPIPCPLVLSLRRALGRTDVALGSDIVIGSGPYPSRQVPVPADMAAWLVKFDAGLSPGPATFEVQGLP